MVVCVETVLGVSYGRYIFFLPIIHWQLGWHVIFEGLFNLSKFLVTFGVEIRNLFQSSVIWTTLILNKNLRTWLFFFITLFQVCIHSCWPGFSSTMLWVFLTMSAESSSWTSRVSVAGGAASSWLPSVFQLWTCQRTGLVAYNIKMPLICHNLLRCSIM